MLLTESCWHPTVPFKHFRHFLEGRPFTLYTDHKPLTFAVSSETDRSPRQTRHLAFIAEFITDFRHIRGKFNVVADVLSRITTTSNAADTINLCPVSTSHPMKVDWTDFAQLAKDQSLVWRNGFLSHSHHRPNPQGH